MWLFTSDYRNLVTQSFLFVCFFFINDVLKEKCGEQMIIFS